nr:phage major tail protein 2 [uncultured Mediterranean phage uvMED]BAR24128.1 phage major tail protein 2 [uncultured Mediterranean phage uvMED]|tara:strand:- start:358 stop:780 length:423 start_codon:yes stop_codon:yes gene_type:complete
MAILRGEQGSVQFETGSGSLATVVGTRSWSLNVTKDTLDVTDHGDTSRHFVGSLISGSGTVELVYDPDATNQPELIEDVFKASDTVDATFELFTTGSTTTTDSVKFAGIVTSMDISSTVGDLVVATCNFITSGDITSNLQ